MFATRISTKGLAPGICTEALYVGRKKTDTLIFKLAGDQNGRSTEEDAETANDWRKMGSASSVIRGRKAR